MHEIKTEAIAFYLALWSIAVVTTFARTIRDHEFVTFGHCLATSFTAGFFAFGVVGVWIGNDTDSPVYGAMGLGIAALLSFFGPKDQVLWIKEFLSGVLSKSMDVVRIAVKSIEDKEQPKND